MKKNGILTKLIATTCTFATAISLTGCGANTVDMSGVKFESKEFVYDGTVKSLEVENLPEGVDYSFTIKNELGNEIRADEVVLVGEYYFTANFTSTIYVKPSPLDAKLTIAKASYDMSKFGYDKLDYVYDGEPHKPNISGVPEGVSATEKVYSLYGDEYPEGPVNSGTYRVVTEFSHDSLNHNYIDNIEAFMTINPISYDDSGIQITNLNYVYDGKAHLPTVTGLPEGVTYSFTIYKDGDTQPINNAINAGTYHVVVSFTGDNNHTTIPSRIVDLFIDKATYNVSNVKLGDLSQTYDGNAHFPSVKNLPSGITYSFKFYQDDVEVASATEIGSYRVVAKFNVDDNHKPVADKEGTLKISKGNYDMTNFSINGLEVTYDGEYHLPTVSGVPEGVNASIKVFDAEDNELVDGVKEIGSYKVVVSFVGGDKYNPLADRKANMVVSKATYDMSNFKIGGLERDYTGDSYVPVITGVPEGIDYSVKLYPDGSDTPVEKITNAGTYKVVVSFTVDGNHEVIQDREATFVVAKSIKTLDDVEVYSKIFNVNDTNRTVDIIGDTEGTTPVIKYTDKDGNVVSNINEAPVGIYDAEVIFEDDNYEITNVLHATLEVTNKVVKNIATYQDLCDMAYEAQQNFGLFEADSYDLAGDPYWDHYNGGNPEERWANQVTYQLVNDIDCEGQSWKSVGWDVGTLMLTEVKNEKYYVKGTEKEVKLPYVVGYDSYGLGYVNLYLDGNGHKISNLKIDENTHVSDFTQGNELGQYPSFLSDYDYASYRRAGMFLSTSFSTFKNIVFDHPVMELDNPSGSATIWAGFINASEGFGNTYEGLTFINPVIDITTNLKSVIGTISGTNSSLMFKEGSVRGADAKSDVDEENSFLIKDVKITNADYSVICNGDRNTIGGIYGESQGGWSTYTFDNVDIDGAISLSGSSDNNNAADLFGYVAHDYMSKGSFYKDPDPYYTFNIIDCDTNIAYSFPASVNFGIGIEGDSYHRVELTAETYEANKYYYLPYKSDTMTLATGAFDANYYYFEKGEGKEILDTNYVYFDTPSDLVGLLNDRFNVINSTSLSGIDVDALKQAITFESLTVDYDGNEHGIVATNVPDGVVVEYDGEVSYVDSGEYVITANFSYKSGVRTLAKWTQTAILKITPTKVTASSMFSFQDTEFTYDGTYQEIKLANKPNWLNVEYVANIRKEIGSQPVYAVVENVSNPNIEFSNNVIVGTFTIKPYVYDIDEDDDTLIAVASQDQITLSIRSLGTSGTADVVYFYSYEYFTIDELAGVSTIQSDGTKIEDVLYVCGTNQQVVFDRYLPGGYDMIYCKFSLRINGSEGYELLHHPVYCKSIESQYGYSEGLNPTVKGIDYPPMDFPYGRNGADDAAATNSNFITYNILLQDCVWANEYIDENGNVQSNIPNIPMDYAIPFESNGTTYYMRKCPYGYFSDDQTTLLDSCVKVCEENNVNIIGCLYNWNTTDTQRNPYFATYPDARDTGSMEQFALNTSNPLGAGYVVAVVEFMMSRYSKNGRNNFRNLILGNELELCQKWYPIQTYAGQQIYSTTKFSAEYIRTLRLANNAIKKYIPDGMVFAPFSRYMSESSISKDFIYTISSLLEDINYISKLEGDFDWGVVFHPYDHSAPNDIVYSSLTHTSEFNPNLTTQGITYTNAEVMDRFLKQEEFLYNGDVLRRAVMCEAGINNLFKTGFNEGDMMASAAFAYYRAACLDCIYAICMSDYGKFNMRENVRALWTELNGENTFELTDGLFNNFTIFVRETKQKLTPAEVGITSWVEMMDFWNDPATYWDELWNPYKIMNRSDIDWEPILANYVTIPIVTEE